MIRNMIEEPTSGVDSCFCGSKYWDGYICHSCQAVWHKLIEERAVELLNDGAIVWALRTPFDETANQLADGDSPCESCGTALDRATCWSILFLGPSGGLLTMDATTDMISKTDAIWLNICPECALRTAPGGFRVLTKERPQTWNPRTA